MQKIADALQPGDWLYNVHLRRRSIIFFCYFYTAVTFNPVDVADNMKKHGGFIPGIRPGKTTAEYIDRVLTRITFGGALYISAICVLPSLHAAEVQGAVLRSAAPACSSSSASRSTPCSRSRATSSRATTKASPAPRGRASAAAPRRQRAVAGDAWRDASDEPHPARPPGAGKGTQASGSPRASASRRSRPATCCARRVARARRSARRPRRSWTPGKLVPDEVVIGLVEERLASPDAQGRLHPRRLPAHHPAGRGARRRARRSWAREARRVVDVEVPRGDADRAARRPAARARRTARPTT